MSKKSKEQIYLTPDGTRVRLAKVKQHFVHSDQQEWLKDILEESNERIAAYRVKDGHEIWSLDIKTLKPE